MQDLYETYPTATAAELRSILPADVAAFGVSIPLSVCMYVHAELLSSVGPT